MNELLQTAGTFDFLNNKIVSMNLETLKRTHMEDDYEGNPQRGIYHFQAIEKVVESCQRYNLNYEVEEIFAANNNSRVPGVTILKREETIHGERAVEAHALRRIFATIRIKDLDTDELTTTVALAYHQDGIQVAIGPCVLVCHNQCILGPERMISNYGKEKVTTEQLFETVDQWLSRFETEMTADRERILRMKNTPINQQEIYAYIGYLTSLRVAHDSDNKELSSQVTIYPLNQSQITQFTEEVLVKMMKKPILSAWDLYNIATELYKPGKTDVPALLPQNVAFATTLDRFCSNKLSGGQTAGVN